MAALDAFGIEYLIVGGVAVGFHSVPRYTQDLDVLVTVKPPDGHERLYNCLREFGAPTHLVRPDDFLAADFVFHFGAPPWRIDILTSIPCVDFDEAYRTRVKVPFADYSASCLSRDWLIKAKLASGRPQDILDALATWPLVGCLPTQPRPGGHNMRRLTMPSSAARAGEP